MPLMIVSKREKELIEYIRQMSFEDVFDVAGAVNSGAETFPKHRSEKIKEFRRVFTYANKEYREL